MVEDLGPDGKPLEPEPVPPEERLPIELVVKAPDDTDSKAQLIDLMEMALGLETEGPESVGLRAKEGFPLKVNR